MKIREAIELMLIACALTYMVMDGIRDHEVEQTNHDILNARMEQIDTLNDQINQYEGRIRMLETEVQECQEGRD
jgi:TolA-binding protein